MNKEEKEIVVIIVDTESFKNSDIKWRYAAVFKDSEYKKITDSIDKLQDDEE